MTRTVTAFVLTGGVGIGLVCLWGAVPASADSGTNASLSAMTVAHSAFITGGENTYVGSKKCKKCHIKQTKSWKKLSHANALETLKPGNKADVKKAHGLDPDKDYSTDSNCVKCHTTGFGHEGGYFIPDAADAKAVKKAKKLAGVGCESCHGPGSAYIGVFKEIQKSKRKYKVDELYAVGLTKMGVDQCKTCHNEGSPTFDASKPFDYEALKKTNTHDHIPLKQRE